MRQLSKGKSLAIVGQACHGGGRVSDAHALQLVRFLGGDLAQNAAQLMKIYRLGEMEIEPGSSATLDVFSRGKATDRYGFNGFFSFGFGNHIVAGAIGQSNVTQDDIELFGVDHALRVLRAIGHGNFVAEMTQETRQRLQRLAMILHHQNTQTLS